MHQSGAADMHPVQKYDQLTILILVIALATSVVAC